MSDTTWRERCEVAERMRGPLDVCGRGRYVELNGSLFGMQLLLRDEEGLRDALSARATSSRQAR